MAPMTEAMKPAGSSGPYQPKAPPMKRASSAPATPSTMVQMENPGTGWLELVEVQSGAYLGEDDIVRYSDIYGRSN